MATMTVKRNKWINWVCTFDEKPSGAVLDEKMEKLRDYLAGRLKSRSGFTIKKAKTKAKYQDLEIFWTRKQLVAEWVPDPDQSLVYYFKAYFQDAGNKKKMYSNGAGKSILTPPPPPPPQRSL